MTIKFNYGKESNKPSVLEEGSLNFCIDSGRLYGQFENKTIDFNPPITVETAAVNSAKIVADIAANDHKITAKLSNAYVGNFYQPVYLDEGTLKASRPGDSNISWGGRHLSGQVSPLDAAMINGLTTNRFLGLHPDAISIEYTRDGGTTWVDYEWPDYKKRNLFTDDLGRYIAIGKHATLGQTNADSGVRVTIEFPAAGVYCNIRKLAFYISTSGSKNSSVSIDITKFQSPNNWVRILRESSLSGWSGWNIVNINAILGYEQLITLNVDPEEGATSGQHMGKIHNLRFTFFGGECDPNFMGLMIFKILAFGENCWSTLYDDSAVSPFKITSGPNALLRLESALGIIPRYSTEKYVLGSSDNQWHSIYGASIYENNKKLEDKYAQLIDLQWQY